MGSGLQRLGRLGRSLGIAGEGILLGSNRILDLLRRGKHGS